MFTFRIRITRIHTRIPTRFIQVQAISKEQVASLISQEGKSYLLLDVRRKDEVSRTGVIPTAQNIPADLVLAECLNHQGCIPTDSAEQIITYCHSGKRAHKIAGFFLKVGFTNVGVYEGGAKEWFGIQE
eukprot:TRINITY_DN2748_c0_g1_i10.p1 TRINITY_DN2748_c0_g1~~TRINITY_DN2748_c0_g1_i10.p1  ORF type:complete len:129 (-),score=11.90 TRINITY_DN2748_c0_g1_i10:206-592(-)